MIDFTLVKKLSYSLYSRVHDLTFHLYTMIVLSTTHRSDSNRGMGLPQFRASIKLDIKWGEATRTDFTSAGEGVARKR